MKKLLKKMAAIITGVAVGITIAAVIVSTQVNSIDSQEEARPIAQTTPPVTVDVAEPEEAQNVEQEEITLNQEEVEMLAKLIWGEARGVGSTTEQAAVIWCVLNRVDTTGYACGGSIERVVTYPGQFQGYKEDHPATADHMEIARDVLMRWYAEKDGETDVGRVLPKGYIYFEGDGQHNYFTNEYGGKDYWDWSLDTPYES